MQLLIAKKQYEGKREFVPFGPKIIIMEIIEFFIPRPNLYISYMLCNNKANRHLKLMDLHLPNTEIR